MFAVWGWGVGINGTSSVVAVSSIFSEYMDFFYFCTCSPWKRKKKKISNFMCCLRKSWVSQQIPLSGWELAVDSPKRDVGTGWWLFLLCRHRPRVSACGEKQFLSPQTLHRALTCTEQVPLSAPVVGAGPGAAPGYLWLWGQTPGLPAKPLLTQPALPKPPTWPLLDPELERITECLWLRR